MPKMPRKATRSLTYVTSQSLGASFNTPSIDLGDASIIKFTIKHSTVQTPVGTFTLQASVDEVTWVPSRDSAGNVRTLSVAGNAQPYGFNVSDIGARFVRLAWVPQTPGYTDNCQIQYSTKLN